MQIGSGATEVLKETFKRFVVVEDEPQGDVEME